MRILIALLFMSSILNAQIDELDFYGDVMINARQAEHRSFAAEKFNTLFEQRLEEDGSFNDEMKNLKWVSKMYALDSSFRVITYQIEEKNHKFKSFGFIQKSDGALIKLNATNQDFDRDVMYMQLDQDSWYGALYYNMIEREFEGRTVYILFGYDGHSEFDRRKVADVISEIGVDKVVFGEEIFLKEIEGERADKMSRILIEFSADSNVTLNYKDGLEMIVHDHLIARIGTMPGQGATHLSDGSLVGYAMEENGIWKYEDRIYDQISPEAPRPQPVLDKGDTDSDIFGKKKKKKKKRK